MRILKIASAKTYDKPTTILFYIAVFLVFFIYGPIKRSFTGENIKVYCSNCDQYLGTGAGFKNKCERCGSNRYYSSKD
jgi:hypothetical protein